MSFGGGKRGAWALNEDGSGTWTRFDASASRYRDLWLAGPNRNEVTHRVTYCAKTGEKLDETQEYAFCRKRCEELPELVPRPIYTVFYFKATTKPIPSEAMVKDPSHEPEKA